MPVKFAENTKFGKEHLIYLKAALSFRGTWPSRKEWPTRISLNSSRKKVNTLKNKDYLAMTQARDMLAGEQIYGEVPEGPGRQQAEKAVCPGSREGQKHPGCWNRSMAEGGYSLLFSTFKPTYG